MGVLVAGAAPAKAPPFDTSANIAYMIDLSSGAVLLSKNADQRMPPASMAKMMTTNVAFELIKKVEIAVIGVGVLLLIVQPAPATLGSIGLGILLQSTALLVFDTFAHHRAIHYV